MDKISIYQTFHTPIEANIVKGRLENEGISCFLSDEHTLTLNPLYGVALGGIKLHIFERDLEKVKALLEEDVQLTVEDLPESEVTCPLCHSSNVGYGSATKKRFNLITIIISFLFTVYPFYINKVWHCHNCDHEFH